jgi:hypothetical protein
LRPRKGITAGYAGLLAPAAFFSETAQKQPLLARAYKGSLRGLLVAGKKLPECGKDRAALTI